MFRFLRRSSAITRLEIEPPAAQPARKGLAIVLIVRNEARHIAEWARFHRYAGARAFFVYDNGCTDGTIDILRAALPSEMLVVIPWNQRLRTSGTEIHNQVLAYAHATRNFGGDFRWMTWIDVDEFLVPVGCADLNESLKPLVHCACISLPWHMFGRSGHAVPPPGGVIDNYLRRHSDPMTDARGLRNFKMIADPSRVRAIKVHSIETDWGNDSCNDRGERFSLRRRASRSFYSAQRIQLNHYYSRSDAELRAKIARGPNLTTPESDHLRRVMRKVVAMEASEVEDRLALEYWASSNG